MESIELPILGGTEELSPDGRFFVCLDEEGTLRILEVAALQTVFEQKRFTRWYVLFGPERVQGSVLLGDLGFAYISFSTDSRFVVVWGSPGSTLAWDLRNRVALKLNGDLKGLKDHETLHFAFLTSGTSLITHKWGSKRGFLSAKVVEFPSGEVLSQPTIPIGTFYRSTYPGFVLVRPFGRSDPNVHRTAAANLTTGQVIISDGALDVFGQYYVAEIVNGTEVGLYEIGKGLQTSVVLHGK